MDESQSLGSFIESPRAEYPATSQWIYLDSVTHGLLPLSARNHALDYLDALFLSKTVAFEAPWENVVRDCVQNFAQMIGAQTWEVGLSPSFSGPSEVLSKIVKKLRGGNIIICSELTRPDIVAFVRYFAFRYEFNLVELHLEGELSFPLHRLSRMVNDQTSMVLLPAVSYWRGWRLPLAKIAAICKKHDAFFLADGSSSAGIIELGDAGNAFDGLLVSPKGNALGLEGICFFFVDESKLSPESGFADGFNYAGRPNPFLAQSHIHFIDLLIARTALKSLNEFQVSRIEKHACGLAAQLQLVFNEFEISIDAPMDASHQSHVVAVGLPPPYINRSLDPPVLKGLAEKLTSGRVRFANCRGQLQFGFHLYNRLQDVEDIRRILAH